MTKNGQIYPFPADGDTVCETIPCFCWLKAEGCRSYVVEIKKESGETVFRGETDRGYLVPDIALEPGRYLWNLYSGELERGEWSFEISPDAETFVRPTPEELLDAVPDERPRHLFAEADIPEIKRRSAPQLQTLRRNVTLAYSDGFPEPPKFHRDPDAVPYREYFGRYRDFVDRDMVACALAYKLLDDSEAGLYAKRSFLTVCDFNSDGPCSLIGGWGDEVGLSNARCLGSVYDLIFGLLDEKQRAYAEKTLESYALQCEKRLISHDFCQNPGESHAGRIPAYLGELAMVLKGGSVPEETLKRWLGLALEIYGGIFPYFGTPDGGWAEGMFYCTSYTKWYLPFFSAVERYTGKSFLRRPFYARLTQYFTHFSPPNFEIHPFGDGYWCSSDDPEWPGFFAQNPYGLYARRFGPALARRWEKECAAPEIFKLHLLDVFLPDNDDAPPSRLTGELSPTRAFPDAGFASMHSDIEHPENDVALLSRASKFGSVSHEHADQGSFALMCGGKALISPSGYFGREYGTAHHRHWTNTTAAHNAILVDGAGQPEFSFEDVGRVLFCGEKDGEYVTELDLSGAYPSLKRYIRRLTLSHDGTLATIEDECYAGKPVVLSWLLHTLSEPEASPDGIVRVSRGATLEIIPVFGGLTLKGITDRFGVELNEGVPEKYRVTMPKQYHIAYITPSAAEHRIKVELRINRINRIKRNE